jgi:hypothetical protein
VRGDEQILTPIVVEVCYDEIAWMLDAGQRTGPEQLPGYIDHRAIRLGTKESTGLLDLRIVGGI